MTEQSIGQDFITIAPFGDAIAAYFHQTRLESEGIECLILDEHAPDIGVFEVRLQVKESDAQKALEILRQEPPDTEEPPS